VLLLCLRLCGLLLAVLLLAAGARAQEFVPGDLSGDGAFDVVDSVRLRRALESLEPGIVQDCVALVGDVNADAVVDLLDSDVLRNALVGLGPGITQTCAVSGDDADGDGFRIADGDCNDTNPLVSPAAFDFIGNGLDDDCDGTIDTPRGSCDTGLPSNASAAASYASALDLCRTAVEDPPANERTWGVIQSELTLADGTGTPSPFSHSIRSTFGSNNGPRFGSALAVISTGRAAATGQTDPDHFPFQVGTSQHGDTSALPADWLAAHGGEPPLAPGCPTAQGRFDAYDSTTLRLRIRVPSNARSFRLAAKHFNADYPEAVCSPFNDSFLVLLDSSFAETPANPTDGNLAVVDGIGVGANLVRGSSGLFQDCVNGPTGCSSFAVAGEYAGCVGTDPLLGTSYESFFPLGSAGEPGYCSPSEITGGATAWLGIRGNVVPGETIELRIILWDVGDAGWDSTVLLDDFRWFPTEIDPGTIAD
jgi:hypothetical protein